MGIETRVVQELFDADSGDEALLGSRYGKRNLLPYPKETEFRFFIGCLNDETSRLQYEALLTQSYRCQNVLKKPGDLAVLDMQGTFDKEGCYHVVSRYAIIPENLSK